MSENRELMPEERRRHYRVTPEALADIEVWFHLPRFPDPLRVVLIDIAAGGAGIDLPQLSRGALELGEFPMLELRAAELTEPVQIETEIVNVRNGVDQPLRAGLAFRNWMDNRSTLDPQLWRIFNQRRTVRVEPKDEIRLVLRGRHGNKMRGTLRDLSLEGLGLWIRRKGAESAGVDETLRLTVQLPGMRKELEIVGQARHLQIWQGAAVARSGMVLGDRRSVPPEARLALQRMIVERQRELRAKGLVST